MYLQLHSCSYKQKQTLHSPHLFMPLGIHGHPPLGAALDTQMPPHSLLHCSYPSKTGDKSYSTKAKMLCSPEAKGQDIISHVLHGKYVPFLHILLPQQESSRKVSY